MGRSISVNLRKIFLEVQTKDLSDAKFTLDIMVNKSYVVWNNKGGVGKSTITFHIASVYAEINPERDVVVIDMCPQANVSMMLMGGGQTGEKHLQSLINNKSPKTVVGYITDSIIKADIKDLTKYIVNIHGLNRNLPPNLYLLSGDGNLELIAPLLWGDEKKVQVAQ
jgi:cellulose biosynthesis protein BcsQ